MNKTLMMTAIAALSVVTLPSSSVSLGVLPMLPS